MKLHIIFIQTLALVLSFIQACLQWDPAMRATPEEALRHEWITEGSKPHPQQPRFQPVPVRSLTASDMHSQAQASSVSMVPSMGALLAEAAQSSGLTSGGQLTSRQHYDPTKTYGVEAGHGNGFMTARAYNHSAAPNARHLANQISASRAQSSQVCLFVIRCFLPVVHHAFGAMRPMHVVCMWGLPWQ